MRVPGLICFSTTSVGELKKTMESLSAPSTNATASASTPSAAPINVRRRCLRVIARFRAYALIPRMSFIAKRSRCSGTELALEPQSLDEVVEPLQLAGLAGQRATRIYHGGAGLVGLAQHHIGAHQPQPSLHVGAVAIEPLGEPLD